MSDGPHAPPPTVDPSGEASSDVSGGSDDGSGSSLRQVRSEQRRLLMRKPGFLFGVIVTGFWVLTAIVPSLFTSRGEREAVSVNGTVIPRAAPSGDAWFGTDAIGNDVFARVIYGSRNVLIMAPIAAIIAVMLGAILGLLMGYYRGWLDEILSRVIEAILSLPVILLALMVLVLFGNSRLVIVLTVAGLFTPVVTRTVRAAVIGETQLDYVTSAKLRGENGLFIMLREILPNVSRILVVELTVRIAYAIFTIATLAFLGLTSDDATRADWGRDIAEQSRLIVAGQWWGAIFPALAIASLVIAMNLIADSIEEVTRQ